MNAWDHLPNAKYIDLVLASLNANPDEWAKASDISCNMLHSEAWIVAWDTVCNFAEAQIRLAARRATRGCVALGEAQSEAWYVIVALISWDDCAHMLDSDPSELLLLSKLGVHAATLMISGAAAFKSIREKEYV